MRPLARFWGAEQHRHIRAAREALSLLGSCGVDVLALVWGFFTSNDHEDASLRMNPSEVLLVLAACWIVDCPARRPVACGKEMREVHNERLAAAASLAGARAAWSMATLGEHFCSACQGAWLDRPPPGLAHILLGGPDVFPGRTPTYDEFHEVDNKLWVRYDDHGYLVYSREGGNMTEQRGCIVGRWASRCCLLLMMSADELQAKRIV